MTRPVVTVVVCSYNGAATLPRTLSALAKQRLTEVELLVVDDGSSDDTAKIAADAGVRVIQHQDNRGLAAARNTGWRAASAELVAFTDDDCRPEPGWLVGLVAAAQRHSTAAAVGGSVTVCGEDGVLLRYLQRNNPLTPLEADLLADDRLLHRLSLYLRRSGAAAANTRERLVGSVVGANMAFPFSVLHAAGGFDERFRFGGEEEDLCRRLVLAGNQLWFTPAAVVEHDFAPGLADTLRRSQAYGRGNARMFLKHPGVRPTAYPLPLLVGALVALAISRRSAIAAAAAVAAPMAVFSRWPRQARATGQGELLGYPYLQLAQETWSNVGLLQGIWQYRRDFADRVTGSP